MSGPVDFETRYRFDSEDEEEKYCEITMQRLKDKRNFGEIILIPQKRGFERNFALSIHVTTTLLVKPHVFFFS